MGKLLNSIGELAPKKTKDKIASLLEFSSSNEDPKHWLGKKITYSLIISILVIAVSLLLKLNILFTILLSITFFSITLFTSYTLLYFRVEDRKNQVERTLPDLLHLIASNISAGVTPMVALRMAARDELGPISDEIKYVTTRSMSPESLSQIFAEISKKIKSNTLERIVELFASSIVAGGNIIRLLDTTAEDLRETQELKRQLVSGTSMYIIFILFMTIVGMPMLFSVSLQFIEMLNKFQIKQTVNISQQIGLAINSPISAEFIYNISLTTILITSLLASIFISVIHSGKRLNGLRYAPFIILASYISFFFMRFYVLKFLFGF
ncbi:type II secretion system F family protein [Candidatus Micrarchaeota archaeon]|nr:type II secretion system F family protein [Candidatus Micrarchaeota archaeon]